MTDQAGLEGADLLFADEPTETAETDEPIELTEDDSGADTGDNPHSEEETEPEDDDESDNDSDDDSDDSSEDSDTDDELSEDEELYLEIEGEQYSLSEIMGWKKNGMLEKKFTQLRMEDAKRENQNKANETQIAERLQRTEAMAQVIEEAATTLLSEGYSETEMNALKSKATLLQKKLAEDKAAAAQSKGAYERGMLAKRNKTWFNSDGSFTDEGAKQIETIRKYAVAQGYTNQEWNEITNHKVMLDLHKAAKFDARGKKTVDFKKRAKKVPVNARPKKQKAAPKTVDAEQSVFGTF